MEVITAPPRASSRTAVFQKMFDICKSVKAAGPYLIVEIGTFRGDFEGDGGSTYFFAKWLSENGGGKLHSVDNNPQAIEISRNVCKEFDRYIEWHNMRSEDFLRTFHEHIDMVYLDSIGWRKDGVDQFTCQYQHLKDWMLVKDRLNGALGIDDTDGLKYGKGAQIVAYLNGKGVPWQTVYCVEHGKWPCGVVAEWRYR
ncbi:MAG: class I SAM-dependent methyltransferase [Thermodesulfobacteriota bacterium]